MYSSMFLRMPEILGGAVCKPDPGGLFYLPPHLHVDNSELLLIVEGEGDFCVDGKPYHARAGSLMCYNRGIWHDEQSSNDQFLAIYVGYTGLQLTGLPEDHLIGTDQLAKIELKEHFVPVYQLFREMIMEWHNAMPESKTISNQLLGLLLGRLVRLLHYNKVEGLHNHPAREFVHAAKRYIEENYYTEVDLNALSNLTHISAYHLINVFKSETGLTPIQYLIRYRMEVAKHYLSTTSLSISKIAERIGYRSDTYFQNLFKKTIGVPPGRYRSEQNK